MPFISEITNFYKENVCNINNFEQKVEHNRKIFNSYPIYLKNSIFHNDEDTIKLRQLSITEKSFIWDKYRSHGNKNYHKNNIKKALFFYERVIIFLEILIKMNQGFKLFQMA